MKKDIHPTLHTITVHCTCGNEFETLSTAEEIKTTLCSNCHPFFTGEAKHVDVAGRIEKFNRRYKKAASQKK